MTDAAEGSDPGRSDPVVAARPGIVFCLGGAGAGAVYPARGDALACGSAFCRAVSGAALSSGHGLAVFVFALLCRRALLGGTDRVLPLVCRTHGFLSLLSSAGKARENAKQQDAEKKCRRAGKRPAAAGGRRRAGKRPGGTPPFARRGALAAHFGRHSNSACCLHRLYGFVGACVLRPIL